MTKVQQYIWDIFAVVKEFCDENGMEYYMLGGTLLGAVRHHGFIPWDDDIDIGLPRQDYERFLELVPKALPDYLELQTYWDSTPHHYYFARVVDKRHQLKRLGSEVEREEPVWVDIFPLDGMPNGTINRGIHKLRLLYVRTRYHIACFDKVNLRRPGRPWTERVVIEFISKTRIGVGGDSRRWADRIDRLLKKYPLEQSNHIINFMGQYKFKEMFPKSWYGGGAMYDFETTKLRGPQNAGAVLTQMYGDYMTPPKEQNRNAHAAELNENED